MPGTVLVICPRWPSREGHVEGSFVREQVAALTRRGWSVVVAETLPWPRWFLRARQDRRQDSPALAPPSGASVVHVPYPGLPTRGLRGWSAWWCARMIRRAWPHEAPPTVIHAHFTIPCGAIGVHLGRHWGTRTVLTVHENREWFLREAEQTACRRVWRDVDVPVRVNRIDLPVLRQENPDACALPNGFSTERLTPIGRAEARQWTGVPAEDPLLFCLGALVERKGQRHLIQAMALLAQKQADPGTASPVLALGGTGPDEAELRALAETEGVADRVRFLGRLSDEEVSRWYHAADATLLASSSEGNPTVLFESLGCGTPFIGTRVGGVDEILVDDRLGRVVDSQDADSFATAIAEVLATPTDHDWIRRHASQYTWDNITAALEQIYGRAAENPKDANPV